MPAREFVDHRQSPARDLLDALARGEPLALAETYRRSAAAAHAVAARLLGASREVESLLCHVYAELWREPPPDVPLEAWVRQRTFALARDRLLADGRAPSSPSAALLLGESEVRGAGERTERAVAALDDDALRALLLAHDRGQPTAAQDAVDAPGDLRRALLALAEADDVDACDEPRVADFVLGLLDEGDEEAVTEAVASRGPCGELAKHLRRGRRRIEGLPPAPDLGQRVIAYVLAVNGTSAAPASAPSAEPESGPGPEPEAGPGPEPEIEPEVEPEVEPESASAAWPVGEEPRPGEVAEAAAEPGESPGGEPLAEVSSDAPPTTVPVQPDTAAGAAASAHPEVGDGDDDLSRQGGGDDAVLSDLLDDRGEAEEPEGGPSSAASDEAAGALDVIDEPQRGDHQPAAADAPAAPPGPAGEDQHLDDLSVDEDQVGAPPRGRSAATILLTIIGALLLLAAGGIAGLLLVRVVLS